MSEAIKPILCRALMEKQAIPGPNGGVMGYREFMPSSGLTVTLKSGRVEHLVGPDNRVIQKVHEGVYLKFERGTLEVTPDQMRAAGMSREEVVAVLRERAVADKFEIVSEGSDARKPGVPVGAGR